MTPYQKRTLSPIAQRMAGDMCVRNLSQRTIDAYTYHVDKFCHFFGKPAEELGLEEIRQYQLHLVNDKKASWSSFNQAVWCGAGSCVWKESGPDCCSRRNSRPD